MATREDAKHATAVNGHATTVIHITENGVKTDLPSQLQPNFAESQSSQTCIVPVDQVVSASSHSGTDEIQTSTCLSEGLLVWWTLLAFIVFTVAWSITTGGYKCSLMIFPFFVVYSYSTYEPRSLLLTSIVKRVKSIPHIVLKNIISVIKEERTPLVLLTAFAVTKIGLHLFHPKSEASNGSPLSLILFTVYYIMLYILPTLSVWVWHAVRSFTYCIRFCLGKTAIKNPVRVSSFSFGFFLARWRTSIIFTLVAVIVSYVFDGDLTSILRYLGHQRSCWPLLASEHDAFNLPYPLQHAWLKQWHIIFRNYKPHTLTKKLIILGREMEVIHLLPVLIGTYVLAQVCLPQKNWLIKKVLFGCISGVVLSGVTSGALKIFFHRYRPNAYGNPYMWTGPGFTTVNHLKFSKLDLSFPCGHTAVSTSIATCLYLGVIHGFHTHSVTRWTKMFLVILNYFYPIIVLVSRVSECNHWMSDAVFGVSYSCSICCFENTFMI